MVKAHVNAYMKARCQEFAENFDAEVTPDRVAALTSVCINEARKLNMDKLLCGEDFPVSFLGTDLHVQAWTSVELARFHAAAAVKTMAIKSGALNQMRIEEDIKGPVVIDEKKHTFNSAVLSGFCTCREKVDTLIKKEEFKEASSFAEFMNGKKSVWWRLDVTFSMDLDYIKCLSGEVGGTFLKVQAVAQLPDGSMKFNIAEVLLKLRKMSSTTAWLFAPKPARGVVEAIIGIVSNMERGTGPRAVEFPTGTTMEAVGERLANFCCFETAATEEAQSELHFGKAALALHIEAVQASLTEDKLTDLGPVTMCEVYRWMLDKDGQKQLDNIGQDAYDVVIAAPKAAAGKEAGKAGPSKKTASGGGGSAMEHMVAAHENARAEKALKRAASSGKLTAPAGKKGKKQKAGK